MRSWAIVLVAGLLMVLGFSPARAEAVRIVALGASDAGGYGVGADQAWPAQLERMLRAKGYDVSVSVNSVSGDTSAGVLARADAAASGARIVVFDTGGSNDRRSGSEGSIQSNIAQIKAHIRAHGAVPIQTGSRGGLKQADGIHSSAQGHARVAAQLVPQVMAVIGKPK